MTGIDLKKPFQAKSVIQFVMSVCSVSTNFQVGLSQKSCHVRPPSLFLSMQSFSFSSFRLHRKQMTISNIIEPRHEKTCLREFPTRSDSNRPAQLQKLAWGLKFWLQKLETLHYLGSEQQRRWSDCADAQADLRLVVRIWHKTRFLMARLSWFPFIWFVSTNTESDFVSRASPLSRTSPFMSVAMQTI